MGTGYDSLKFNNSTQNVSFYIALVVDRLIKMYPSLTTSKAVSTLDIMYRTVCLFLYLIQSDTPDKYKVFTVHIF